MFFRSHRVFEIFTEQTLESMSKNKQRAANVEKAKTLLSSLSPSDRGRLLQSSGLLSPSHPGRSRRKPKNGSRPVQKDPGEMQSRARSRKEGSGVYRLPAEILALTRTPAPPYSIRSQVHTTMGPATIEHYLASLRHPRQIRGVRSPVNVNVAPSVTSTTATTVCRFTTTVALNTSTQIAWFPGHTSNQGGMHPSYSTSSYLSINVAGVPTTHVASPVNIGAFPNMACVLTTGITLNSASQLLTSNGGAGGTAAIVDWDVESSLVAPVDTDYWHRVVSCSIRITNPTTASLVGGTIVSVVPGSTFDTSATVPFQEVYAIFPTYNINDAAGSTEVVWTPRATDLGYWGYTSGVTNATVRDAGILIWLNGATSANVFTVEIVTNWEMAGAAYRQIASPAPTSDKAGDVTKQIVSQVHAGSLAAKSILEGGMSIVKQMEGFVPSMARVAQKLGQAVSY